ncbi:MAG: retention module-containing protein, partial [Chthoniobacter sp.]|nr:retention module-containing protein [Chthoniobacter sp.]
MSHSLIEPLESRIAPASLSILDAQVSEGNSATKSLTFQITLNEPSAEQVTVLFSTSNGTATTADNDYLQVVNNAVVFAPNEITKNVTVTINGDQKPEGNETLLVTLTNPSEGTTIADGQAVGTITNDDVLLTIGDATANEDAGTLSFTVRLGARPDALTVQYSTVNGTATAGSDFTAPEPGAQLVFAPEEFEKTITIPLTADAVDELTERFTVQLSDASFGPNTTPFTITDATGAGTIVNDDLEVSLEALQTSILEGDAELTNANYLITLSSASTHDVRVFYTTQNGTAVGGSISTGDFVTTSGSIVIAAGQTSTTISVPIVGDKVIEADETFSFSLSSVEDAILGDVTSASTTILNDDPSFRISDATLTEGDDGSVTAVFAVTLSAQPGQLGGVNRVVRVNYATADGTGETGAKDGVGDGTVLPDYEATNGTLSFTNGGPLTKTIAVTVLGDRAKELAQNLFSVNLSGAEVGTIGSGEIFVKEADATLADGVGIGTIIDNDAAPTVSINDIAFREDVSGSEGRAFAVTLSQPSDLPVQVLYNAVSGTATAGTDFTAPAAGASLTIQPGQTSAIIAIPAIADTTVEGDETFTVQLSGATQSGSALTISKNAGLGTILEDDVTVSIANAQIPEPGTTANMPFTVTLSQASTRDVVVTFNTANGTATGGSDFTAITAGSITIPAGSVTGTINVPILPDNLTETDETLTVQVTGASNAQLAAAASVATGTILNDDAPPVISIANVTAIEGTNKAVFKVTLDHPTITPVTVKYSTANGTAIATAENAPGDYTAVPEGTVTIPAGSVEAIFEVAVANDNLDEADETFRVVLSEPSANATLPAGTAATATIQDDDASPLLSIANVQALENVAGGKAQFTVTLSTISAQEVRVDYTTAPGSAAAGADQDFLSQTGTLVFAAGETSKTVSIDINPDAVPEPDETFSVNLTNPVNALLSDAQGVGTILNDESSLKIEPTVSIAEGNPTGEPAGAFKTLTFTVTRAGAPTAENATVQFATAEGTARSSGPRPDFVATSGTLTFTGAETEKTITVQVANDLNYENDEQFSVVLSNSVNAALLTPVDATGTTTITNDDAVPTLTIEDVSANEANSGTTPLIFKAKLSAANEKDANVQVTVQTANGTAVAPADFTALSATTITFAPGEVEKSITVNVAGDPADESDETFELILSGLTAGATLGAGAESATGTILDNDATPRLSISDLSYAENLSGDPTKVFTVTLSGASQNPVTVSYRTIAGTALAGTDFTAVANGLLTFAPGEISKTISIALVDDLLDEADEAFQVQLENPTNATLSDAFATGTIVDDDAAPALVINDVEIVEGDSGTSNAVFTVSLSAVSGKTV